MRGLIEHACHTCGATAELDYCIANWTCPECTQTEDLKGAAKAAPRWHHTVGYGGLGDSFA